MAWGDDKDDKWRTGLRRLSEREPDWGEPAKPNPLFAKWKADPSSIPELIREREKPNKAAAHRILDAVAGKFAPPSIGRLKSLRAAQFAEGLTEEEADALEEAYRSEVRRLTAAGREDSTDFRKRFLGDPELAARYLGPARTLLGQLKNDMAFHALDQGMRRALIPIDERSESGPFRRPTAEGAGIPDTGHNDWLLNPTGASGGEGIEERTERRITGNVHLYAMSNHGIDEVWVDARSVTTIEEKKIPGAGLEYFPYLWVGIATEGGGNSPSFRGADRNDMFRQVGLHVFEPLTDAELAQVLGSEDHQDGFHFYAGTARALNTLSLGDNPGGFGNDMPAAISGPNEINFSDDKLYYMPFGVAGSLAPDRESENARLWQQAVCLDPEDKKKTLSQTGPVMYGNYTYAGYPLGSVEWQEKGKVRPGKYLIKANAFYEFTCQEMAGPDFDVIIKVIVGKAPGRISTVEIRVPFTERMWSWYDRDIYPQGDAGTPEGPFYDFPGPNPHGPSWWQGGIEVDVQLGLITPKESEVVIPPWGFVPSAYTVNELCWNLRATYTVAAGVIAADCEFRAGPEIRCKGAYGASGEFPNSCHPTGDLPPISTFSGSCLNASGGSPVSSPYSAQDVSGFSAWTSYNHTLYLTDNGYRRNLEHSLTGFYTYGGYNGVNDPPTDNVCWHDASEVPLQGCNVNGFPETEPPPGTTSFAETDVSPVTGEYYGAYVEASGSCQGCSGTATEYYERAQTYSVRFP